MQSVPGELMNEEWDWGKGGCRQRRAEELTQDCSQGKKKENFFFLEKMPGGGG